MTRKVVYRGQCFEPYYDEIPFETEAVHNAQIANLHWLHAKSKAALQEQIASAHGQVETKFLRLETVITELKSEVRSLKKSLEMQNKVIGAIDQIMEFNQQPWEGLKDHYLVKKCQDVMNDLERLDRKRKLKNRGL